MNERLAWKVNGFFGVLAVLAGMALGGYLVYQGITVDPSSPSLFTVLSGGLIVLLSLSLTSGLTIVQPNQAEAIVFMGKYLGSIRENGFWLTTPYTTKKSISLRVSNFNSEKIKVNDADGNPIEIASVVVYQVVDSAKALFDVEDYEQFIEIQSESALRHVASVYPYDDFGKEGLSLRQNGDEIGKELVAELQSRLEIAGVKILEARLTHLAYASEIASAMLQRQQANAIVAARQLIVEGAVGMVQLAIEKLQQEADIHLDEERKATMANNLMVAIVADRGAQPIINTGSLYT